MALDLDRAQEIVATVESKNKAFHCQLVVVQEDVAIVRFQWFDRPSLTAVIEWFKAAGARPMLVGREWLTSGTYGVIRFTEAI